MIWLRYFIRIVLFLKFCTEVLGSPGKLSWGLKRNEKERLLKKFLMDAENHLTMNCPSRHTTILAANNKFLKSARPIFKARPYYTGTNSNVMVLSRDYTHQNCAFIFIDTIDYDYLSRIFSNLSSDYNIKVQIVSRNNLLKEEVRNTLDLAFNKSIENVTITFLENNTFKTFQVFPFTRNCTREIRPSYVWVPDKGLKTYNYDDHSLRNLNKCPVSITTLPMKETITVHESPNGTLNILGGVEGNLILTFAQKLNFTPVLKYPEIRVREHRVNNTIVGLVGDIANRKSDIAIGKLISTLKRREISDSTSSYNHECIVWITPVLTAAAGAALYSEFRDYLWITIFLSIIFSCVFVYNVSRISPIHRKNKTFMEVILDVIRSTLGSSLHRVPADQPRRIYYVSYFLYAMVITVAYRTSLASILTVRKNVQLIKTNGDIVRFGLSSGGSSQFLAFLRDQKEENINIPYLIEHYEIITDIESALDRIKYKKDLAYVGQLSAVEYYKRNLTLSGEKIYFDSFDYCILSYHSVVLVTKGSVLTKELSHIIVNLREFGFIKLWNSPNKKVDAEDTYAINTKVEKLTLSQLQSIFLLYLSGILFSIVTVILENILYDFQAQSNDALNKY